MAKLGQVFHAPNRTVEMHPKWITTWIHYSKLRRSSRQYCDATDQEEIEHLADLICADGGVLQNLIVRKYDADEYEIIAGHKRTLACELLTSRGIPGFEFLPCIVRNESEAKTRLAIISSNAHHEKTQYEIMHEMQELEYLFTHYPEEFTNEELKGRMVERIGRRMGRGKSVVNEYLSISKNLGEKGMEAFADGTLNKDAAYALAGLPEEEQEELLEKGVTKSREIRTYRQDREERTEIYPAAQETHTNVPDSGTDDNQRESVPDSGTENREEEHVPDSGTEELAEFLKNYRSWNMWTEGRFYRCDLPDGDAVVALNWPHPEEEDEGAVEYYLLKKGWRHFTDCRISVEELKNYMKQRGEPEAGR